MFRAYFQLKNRWAPAAAKANPEDLQKAYLIFDLLFLVIVAASVYGIYYWIIGYMPGVWGDAFLVVGTSVLVWDYVKTANPLRFVWGAMVLNFIGVLSFCQWSGTYFSPAGGWFGISIFTSFLLGGKRPGLIYSCFILTWMLVLYPSLEYFFGPTELLFPEEHLRNYTYICNTGLMLFILIMVLSFELTRIELRKQLQLSQTQLVESEKMASLGQLTAGIAHEINNPINFIKGNTQALKLDIEEAAPVFQQLRQLEKAPSEEALKKLLEYCHQVDLPFLMDEVAELIQGIDRGSERVTQIITDLRTFTHNGTGAFQDASPSSLIDAALNILNSKLKVKDIEVVKENWTAIYIPCLGGKLSQVFVNIIDNAIGAMSKQGTLKIQQYVLEELLHIEFADNGKGMDQVTQQRIFDPFYTTKEVGKGTGLGMAISYNIIREHQGTIEVDSELDKGTRIILKLPMTRKELD